jgi:type I restriction enzyme M protein
MIREALRERFLDVLRDLGGNAGNGRLRDTLGWQEETYWSVHAALIESGTIAVGRGRGGSVALVDTAKLTTTVPAPGCAEAPPISPPAPTPVAKPAAKRAADHGATMGSDRTDTTSYASLSSLIWSVADLLRGDYKPSEYGRVILPFTILRRLDCVLAPTKAQVLTEKAAREAQGLNPEPFLTRITGVPFANTSPLDLGRIMGDQDNIGPNLTAYVLGFSAPVRDIFDRFRFAEQTDRLHKAGLLYKVTERFAAVDLSPTTVMNHDMGLAFEELIRKFAEISNETAGEHFTPRDVIKLMVNLLFIEDGDILTPGTPAVRTIYDPTAGTGGMLSVAGEHLLAHNPAARLTMYGQELNDESYAI